MSKHGTCKAAIALFRRAPCTCSWGPRSNILSARRFLEAQCSLTPEVTNQWGVALGAKFCVHMAFPLIFPATKGTWWHLQRFFLCTPHAFGCQLNFSDKNWLVTWLKLFVFRVLAGHLLGIPVDLICLYRSQAFTRAHAAQTVLFPSGIMKSLSRAPGQWVMPVIRHKVAEELPKALNT